MCIIYLSVSGYSPGSGDRKNVTCYDDSKTIDDCSITSFPECSDQDVMALSCVGMYACDVHLKIDTRFMGMRGVVERLIQYKVKLSAVWI